MVEKLSFTLPKWIDVETWKDYELMRKALRKPLTDGARRLAVRRLESLRMDGHSPKDVLEQSIFMGWQGLWPVKRGDRRDAGYSIPIGAATVKEKYKH